MDHSWIARRLLQAALLVGMFAWVGSVNAELDPKALAYLPLDQVKWTNNAN
ncbi:MAG: hypothetical protein HW398_224, partial [Acidobacteria bacterium]|nr:hypothetical protein [Acidobacteriota bacterium]